MIGDRRQKTSGRFNELPFPTPDPRPPIPVTDLAPLPREAAPLFPLRVAAVDVGSNATRFLAAEFSDHTQWTELAYKRLPIRMGHDAFLTGRLDPDNVDAAVAAFADVRERLEELGVGHYRAVATSAVRDSSNGAELVERVANEANVRLETISGREEARLVWMAVRAHVPLGRQPWVLVDLGGGSMEITLADAEAIRSTESHPIGTVRLLEELEEAGDLPPEQLRQLMNESAARLRLPRTNPVGMVATGGNIEALLALAVPSAAAERVGELPVAKLEQWVERLSHMSVRQRIVKLGLRPDRADVILPAAVLYERVARLAGVDRILVPRVGVREGLLLDLVEEVTKDHAYPES